MSNPPVDRPSAAVFLSYASQDAERVRQLCDALRAAGVEVWFDQNELRGGDTWDRKIRQQIRDCALFVPVVSAATQARPEGYFRLEWHLAEQRSLLIAKGRPFLVPVAIDGISEREALAPDAFLGVQWTRLGDGAASAPFVEQVQRLLALGAIPAPSGSPGGRERPESAPPQSDGPPRIPDYQLIRQIGKGSYGDVWLARGVTGIYRAIKVVWRARFADALPFEREFKGLTEFAAISLGESIQLALLHVGRDDTAGYFYYVMELADDVTRGREIDPARYEPLTLGALRAQRGRLPAAECVTLGLEVARILASLHRRGLVHRDIKPSNVIMVGGVPKLADIGLVTPSNEARTFVGTDGYVPPEGPGSPAADVFALGKVLYELCTGLDRSEFPQLPADLKRLADCRLLLELNEIVLRACEPNAALRYRDGAAIFAELQRLQADGRLQPTWRRFFPWALLAGGAGAAAVIAAGWPWAVATSAAGGPPGTSRGSGTTAVAGSAADSGGAGRSSATAVPAPTVTASPSEKSVAVLPFENLSSDPENAYFSEGIHQEITTTLERVSGLRVAQRGRVKALKTASETDAEIARKLNVAHLVRGSVWRSGDQVRIVVELRRAGDDFLIWSQTYNKSFKDSLGIQTEVAQEIARVMQARGTTGLKHAAFLAASPEVYERYLKALTLPPTANHVAEMEAVVAMDPKYLPAVSRLAFAHISSYSRNIVTDPAKALHHAKEGKQWAETAAKLMPGPFGEAALSRYYMTVEIDNARSLELAQRVVVALPNSDASHYELYAALQAAGRIEEALDEIRRAIALEPSHESYRLQELWCLAVLHRTEEWMALRPQAPPGLSQWQLQAVLGETLDPVTAKSRKVRADRLWYQRRYEEMISEAEGIMKEDARAGAIRGGALAIKSNGLYRLGRLDEAAEFARQELPYVDELIAQPAIDRTSYLPARAFALLKAGRAAEGERDLLRHVAAASATNQVMQRWGRESWLASFYAWMARPKECTEILARLLRVPSGVTVPILRMDPDWDPVREDPRFQALLNDPLNSAPLRWNYEKRVYEPRLEVGPAPKRS